MRNIMIKNIRAVWLFIFPSNVSSIIVRYYNKYKMIFVKIN